MAIGLLTRKKINFGYMRFVKILAFFLVTTLMWSCKKDKVSDSPNITFVRQTATSVADSGKDVEGTIDFHFDFEDGYADTGPEDFPTSWQNIHFTDSRNENTLFFDFPPIPSSVIKRDGITGTFTVKMDPRLFIARTDTTVHKLSDTVVFSVLVIDEAQNESNIIMTDSIIILK